MTAFAELPLFTLFEQCREAFAQDGITEPTAAQEGAFEAILSGKHVVVDSGTGTGKTLAYLLPLIQRLQTEAGGRVACLAPAAELAVQTLGVANRYKSSALIAGALVGGGNQKKQKDKITKSTRLVMGTPGRVVEQIMARKLKGLTTIVLDEPEPILSAKDADLLREVLSRPPRPQIVMVGATFGVNAARLIEEFMEPDLVRIKTEDSPLLDQITHHRVHVYDAGDRDLQIARILDRDKAKRTLIYVNQPHLIRHLYRYLCDSDFSVVTLSQDRTKQQCKEAVRLFSAGKAEALITTDRAATGIDIEDVATVIHYEVPRSSQAYVHGSGRTGRAGKSGRSIVLHDDTERTYLKRFERDLGLRFEELHV